MKDWENQYKILHKDVDNMSLVVGHMWSRMFGDF